MSINYKHAGRYDVHVVTKKHRYTCNRLNIDSI